MPMSDVDKLQVTILQIYCIAYVKTAQSHLQAIRLSVSFFATAPLFAIIVAVSEHVGFA